MKKSTIWKEFGRNTLTHSGAHYLMAIHELHEMQGYARLSDVAKRLNITKGSLSTSLRTLINRKLVLEDDNKHLLLSDKGREYALNIENTYFVVKHFLTKVLNIAPEIAEIDACKVEHLLSPQSVNGLLKMAKVFEKHPTLATQLQQEIEHHSNCSLKGCAHCTRETFCLREK